MATTNLNSVLFRRLFTFQRQLISNLKNCNKRNCEYTASYTTNSINNTTEIDHMKKLLKEKFPLARSINIEDISGGCGEMYEVSVESVEFKGLTVVKQHRLVNEALKDQIKHMHGIIIQTTVPTGSMK